MRIAWLLGWAVPAEWFAAEAARVLPGAEHVCVPAASDWRVRLESLPACDALGAYSLGTLLLLDARDWAAERWTRTGLLAPIWAFPAEACRGGRVPRAQLRALSRRVHRDPDKACADFREWAGLGAAHGAAEPPETLRWGLEQLDVLSAAPGLPQGWSAFAGDQDRLLDSSVLMREAPALRVVAGAGHHPAPLLRAWARELATS
jgi:hypothetical protein